MNECLINDQLCFRNQPVMLLHLHPKIQQSGDEIINKELTLFNYMCTWIAFMTL